MTDSNSPTGRGLHHVNIRVDNVETAVAFYKKVFGYTEHLRWGSEASPCVMLDAGAGDILEIFQRAADEPARDGIGDHFAIHVEDCAAMVEKVRAEGVEITSEAKTVTIGQPETTICFAFFRGPGGERVELIQTF